MSKQKKKFFRRPSTAEILKSTKNREITSNFVENILSLKENESLTLIGKMYEEPDENEFFKRGPLLTIPIQVPEHPKLLPFEIRKQVFDRLKDKEIVHYRGFTFTPEFTPGLVVDSTPRVIRLNDILEGARLYSYAPYSKEKKAFQPSIQIVARYDSLNELQIRNNLGVPKDGAEAILTVTSRTAGARKYRIHFYHIPIVNNESKFHIAPMIKTNHVCEDKDNEIKQSTKKEPDFVSEYRIDEHEIAGYFALMDFYKNINKHIPGERHNVIPLRMNMIGIPTPLICKIYDNSLHRVIIKDTPQSNARELLEADLECIMWKTLHKEGHDSCFFFKEKGMKLKDFKWTTYK